ncbi:MAG TPA: hypothetical protein DCZ71_04525 [Ruminococcus sp.]|nr:hypothetical protein [Ruminococcus sp.]
MKLEYDCVRHVLLVLEELCSFDPDSSSGYKEVTAADIQKSMLSISGAPHHEVKDIYYTILKLDEGGFITTIEIIEDDFTKVKNVIDITYQGHQYLDSIRDESIWSSVKSLSPSLTFRIITNIAEKLIMKKIKL